MYLKKITRGSTNNFFIPFLFQKKQMEILNDKRRLTVAVTRAKEKMVLIGCMATLVRYPPIKTLIDCANTNNYSIQLKSLDELDLM
jgi:superfamily I DNA and/or RNA helicase